MITGLTYALLLALIVEITNGATVEPSIAHSVFLPRESDPFCDTYVETITRMSSDELIHLPKLNDTEFLNQLVRGVDTIPAPTSRAGPNKLFDPDFDEQLEHQGDIEYEWEEMMAGGPASISYMGAVVAVASKKDFPLKADFVYKFVKYPNSFQATLVQVSNEMYRALYGAHTSMDKIQTNMRQIPTLIKTALKLITQASPTMMKAMLPRTLANIGQYANESAAIARTSYERFQNLRDLLEEIVETSVLANKDNRETAEKLAADAEDMKNKKKTMDDAMNRIKAEYEIARQDLEKAREDYHVAMINVPGGQWDSAAWDVYAAARPAYTCSRGWFWRSCRSQRDQQFTQFTNEARRKAQDALALLKEAEERSKLLFNQQMNKQDEVGTAINNLANINFNEISINETIKILLDAIEKISIVQKQWNRITLFFSGLSIKAGHTQKVILESFLGAISDIEILNKPLEASDKTLFIMMLVESATDIDRDAHLLFIMAKTYTDVSNEYMVTQIAGLSGLLAIQTDVERDSYVKGVATKTAIMSTKVKNLAAERQRKYELTSFNRQEQYIEFIQEAMMQEELSMAGGIGIGKR